MTAADNQNNTKIPVMGDAQLNSLTGMKKWKTISRSLLFYSVIWELAELFIWFSYNCQELFLSGTSSTRPICLRGTNQTVTFVTRFHMNNPTN